MAPTVREQADERLDRALAERGGRDPREFYRERLRELREQSPDAYQQAVRHYEEVLVPAVASGAAEPLAAWTEYGRRLAELTAAGRTMSVDETGRAEPYEPTHAGERLVLHFPDAAGRALLVGLPPVLSAAQRATYDWLVAGKQKLR